MLNFGSLDLEAAILLPTAQAQQLLASSRAVLAEEEAARDGEWERLRRSLRTESEREKAEEELRAVVEENRRLRTKLKEESLDKENKS